MIWVTEALHELEYKLRICFSDGTTAVIDLEDVVRRDLRPIFRELVDGDKFRAFKVEGDTLVWENGLDLAPEFLYELATAEV